MTTNARRGGKKSATFRALEVPTLRRGWNDAVAGAPFDPEYDRLPHDRQLLYELGRRMAVLYVSMTGDRDPFRSARGYEHRLRKLGDLDPEKARFHRFRKEAGAESRV